MDMLISPIWSLYGPHTYWNLQLLFKEKSTARCGVVTHTSETTEFWRLRQAVKTSLSHMTSPHHHPGKQSDELPTYLHQTFRMWKLNCRGKIMAMPYYSVPEWVLIWFPHLLLGPPSPYGLLADVRQLSVHSVCSTKLVSDFEWCTCGFSGPETPSLVFLWKGCCQKQQCSRSKWPASHRAEVKFQRKQDS